jgi:hypothetical protein
MHIHFACLLRRVAISEYRPRIVMHILHLSCLRRGLRNEMLSRLRAVRNAYRVSCYLKQPARNAIKSARFLESNLMGFPMHEEHAKNESHVFY